MIFDIPISAPSASNLREHWSVRHRRVKGQRAATMAAWVCSTIDGPALRAQIAVGSRFVVTLTRLSPRLLDDDNLRPALKGVRDQLAAILGVDDRPGQPVSWAYDQQKSKRPHVGVKIEMA